MERKNMDFGWEINLKKFKNMFYILIINNLYFKYMH